MNDLCLYRLVVATAFFVSSSPFDSFRMDRRTRVVNDALKWWGEKLLRTIRYNCCCPIRLLTLNAFFRLVQCTDQSLLELSQLNEFYATYAHIIAETVKLTLHFYFCSVENFQHQANHLAEDK